MAELREEHVGTPSDDRPGADSTSVAAELQAAYEEVVAGGAEE